MTADQTALLPTSSARPPGAPPTSPNAEQQLLRVPVDSRSLSLAILATMASIYALHWAQVVCVPIMLALMLSHALAPLVTCLERIHMHRALGAGVVLILVVGLLGSLAYRASDEAAELAQTLPRAVASLSETFRRQGPGSQQAIKNMKKAANEIESVATETVASAPLRGVTKVQIVEPKIDLDELLWSGTLGVAGAVSQAVVVLFLTFFLLAGGEMIRRKLVRISGPTLSRKKITLQVLDEITTKIQRYLAVLVATSTLVGVATWLAFLAIGLKNAAVWGIAAAVLNAVPYVGPVLVTVGSTLVGILQFGSIGMGLSVGAVALVITGIEGYLLTPWLSGRAGRLNAIVVFLSIVFWGWLWGPWGLILGVPIVMMLKSICDHVEDLKPVGELLGD